MRHFQQLRGPTPPVANFTSDVSLGATPLTVEFTDLSTNSPDSWLWDFGDGNTSSSQNPTHVYVTPGTYNVSLNATNAGGSNVSTRLSYITTAATPVSSFTSNVTTGSAPLSVAFTDTSTNSPTTWLWNFGDGNTSTSQNPTHTYATAGIYNVSLNASNLGGSDIITHSEYITVIATPVANFTSNVTSGVIPLVVSFTDTSSNDPTVWLWSFGDGNTSTSQNPTHTYVTAGTYNVSLVATNLAGADQLTQASYITAVTTPEANFTADVTSGTAPLSVSFTDQSANTPASWFWDFGDGSNSTEQNPTHIYTEAGTYNVSLNATNAAGSNTSVSTDFITVDAASSSSSSGGRTSVGPSMEPETVSGSDTSVKHVMGGTAVEFDLSGGDDPVVAITFDAKDNEGLVVTKVQVLKERPSDVPAPKSNSYSIMSIDVERLGTISEDNADNL
ncbi:MAG: PKD domain-containing protein [Methanolobus sp.]